jgi:hypothetical protein
MADPIRQSIMAAVETRLKTIKTTAGYSSNLGNNVFEWLDRDLDASELPGVVYKDRENPIESFTMGEYTNKVNVEIEIRAQDTPKNLRKMIEDVYKAIGTDDRWGGYALDTQPVSDEIDCSHEDKKIGIAKIRIVIEYDKTKWSF